MRRDLIEPVIPAGPVRHDAHLMLRRRVPRWAWPVNRCLGRNVYASILTRIARMRSILNRFNSGLVTAMRDPQRDRPSLDRVRSGWHQVRLQTALLFCLAGVRRFPALKGPYPSWQDAASEATGWDSHLTVSKVRVGLLDVLMGYCCYERDGIAFPVSPVRNTLRSKLLNLWTSDSVVVDFGGGLGGTYVNNRDILDSAASRYIVIEQDSFCEAGSRLAKQFQLPVAFHSSLGELGPGLSIDILIAGGVISYLEDWRQLIRSMIAVRPRHILIDRQVLTHRRTRIYIQETHGYYERDVSYPCWIINQREFLQAFEGYRLIERWKSDFDSPHHMGFHYGFHFFREDSTR